MPTIIVPKRHNSSLSATGGALTYSGRVPYDATVTSGSFGYAPLDADASLVGHWKLDDVVATGVATDSAGTNHGTIVGGVTSDTGSGCDLINTGMTFDGSTGYIRCAVPVGTMSYPFTMAGWCYPTDYGSAETLFAISSPVNSSYYFGVYVQAVLKVVRRNTTSYTTITDATLSNGTWYHVAVVFDTPTSFVLYLDGVAYSHSGLDSVSMTSSVFTHVTIGTIRSVGPFMYFTGTLDDVRIYSRALTPAEVTALYTGSMIIDLTGGVASPQSVASGWDTTYDQATNATLAALQTLVNDTDLVTLSKKDDPAV